MCFAHVSKVLTSYASGVKAIRPSSVSSEKYVVKNPKNEFAVNVVCLMWPLHSNRV